MGPVISVATLVCPPTPVSGAVTTTTVSLTSETPFDQPLDNFAASVPSTPMPKTEQADHERGPAMSASFLSNFTTTTTTVNSSMPIVTFDGLQNIAFNSANGQDFIGLTSDGSITESNSNLNSISVPREIDTVDASGEHRSSEEYTINGLVVQSFLAYFSIFSNAKEPDGYRAVIRPFYEGWKDAETWNMDMDVCHSYPRLGGTG